MPGITAILHTHNDALRIARAVESLRPCDEVLVIDHASSDESGATARRFGARVIQAQTENFETGIYLQEAANDWIFCLYATESVTERLEASLLEWKLVEHSVLCTFGIAIHEETVGGWVIRPAETRLVHRQHAHWDVAKPLAGTMHSTLEGHLTRLRLP
jgi:glycosyltransferase involved in cell wall biosynthesis